MTDKSSVSLKDHMDAINAERLRLGAVVAIGILAVFITASAGNSKATAIALDSERLARTVALDRATDSLNFHNDVIRKNERDSSRYITRGQVYAALGTAIAILALVIAYYANFGGQGT